MEKTLHFLLRDLCASARDEVIIARRGAEIAEKIAESKDFYRALLTPIYLF
jgi:hypothetical protein